MDAKRSAREVDAMIARLATTQHGVVARRQLLEFAGRGAITSRIGRFLHPVHRGVYAVGHERIGRRGGWMAAALALGPDAVLSHRSAAELWGMLPLSELAPQVTTSGRWRARPGIRVHRAPLATDEVTVVDGIPVTGSARTQFDLASVLSRDRLERAMNQAEVLRLTDRLSIDHLLERHPRRRGSSVLRAILGDVHRARGVTANDFEHAFATLVDRHDLPRPRFNANLAIAGRFVRVDALWEDARLVGELDGRQTHGTPLAFESDRERDRQLLIEGWRVTRITWRKLTGEPEDLVSDLRRLLGSASRT